MAYRKAWISRLGKKKHLWLIAVPIVLSGLFLFAKRLQSYTDRLLERAIIEFIDRETRGEYRVRYADLQFDLWANRLQLTDPEIVPRRQAASSQAVRYALRVQSLSLETESLWKIYFTKELKIIGLTFIKPYIRVESLAERMQRSPTFSRQTGNLYLLIKNYLDKFQIKHFALHQATLEFSHRNGAKTAAYKFMHVNFSLQNLVIDSVSIHDKRKIFYADGFDLSIDGQEIILPDSLHAFTFDKLEISTQKSAVTFRNFRLRPRTELPKNKNAYRMNIPELNLQGVEFAKAYNDNYLIIRQMHILQPDIAIRRAAARRADKDLLKADRTFLKILANIFDSVAIAKFVIRQGAFTLKDTKQPRLLLPELDFSLDSFAFAVPDTSEAARFPSLKNVDLTLHNQQFFIGDSLYDIRVKYLRLSSQPAQIRAAGVIVREQLRHERLRADSLLLQLHAWSDLTEKKTLHFRQISLVRPQVHLENRHIISRQTSKPILFTGTTRSTPFAKITADRLLVRFGSFAFTDARRSVRLENCHAEMNRFQMPVNTPWQRKDLLLAATRLSADEILLSNERYNVRIGTARLQIQKGILQAFGEALSVSPQKSDEELPAFSANVRAFSIKNLIIKDLSDDLSEWQPVFDTLRLQGADLRLQSAKNGFARGNRLRGTIVAEQGALTVREATEQFIDMRGIRGSILFIPDSLPIVQATATDVQGRWAGYRFEAKHPTADSRNGNLTLHQAKISQAESDSVQLFLQLLRIQGWDKEAFTASKHLKIRSLFLSQLDGQRLGDASPKANPFFDSLQIDSLIFTGNSFRLVLPAYRLHVNGAESRLYGVRFNPSEASINRIGALQTRQTEIGLPAAELRFAAARLADTADCVVVLDSLQLNFKSNQARFRQVSVGLTTTIRRQADVAFSPINQLALAEGTIHWHFDTAQHMPSRSAYRLPENLILRDTRITGNRLNAQIRLLHIVQPASEGEELQVNALAEHVRWDFPNGTDRLHIARLAYAPDSRQFLLDSLELRPNCLPEEFYQKYSFRKSYNAYFAHRARLNAPCLNQLMSGEGLTAESLSLSDFKVDVFADKTVPPLKAHRAFPLEKFKQMKIPVRIDTVRVESGTICYRERTRYGDTAVFTLNALRGYGYRWNNRPTAADTLYVRMKAVPENAGEMEADIWFKTDSHRSEHGIYAVFNDIPLTVLNGLTVPLAGVRIKSGQIERGEMAVRADRDHAAGKMLLYYKDLKFVILNRKTKEQEETIARRNPLLSIVANTLIRNKNRRKAIYKGKTGYISQEREPEKSMFSFWGRIVLNGMLSSVGISQRMQSRWQQQIGERAEKKE